MFFAVKPTVVIPSGSHRVNYMTTLQFPSTGHANSLTRLSRMIKRNLPPPGISPFCLKYSLLSFINSGPAARRIAAAIPPMCFRELIRRVLVDHTINFPFAAFTITSVSESTISPCPIKICFPSDELKVALKTISSVDVSPYC